MPAQGNALGHDDQKTKTLKGRPHHGWPLQGFVLSHTHTQGVALGWHGNGPLALSTRRAQKCL